MHCILYVQSFSFPVLSFSSSFVFRTELLFPVTPRDPDTSALSFLRKTIESSSLKRVLIHPRATLAGNSLYFFESRTFSILTIVKRDALILVQNSAYIENIRGAARQILFIFENAQRLCRSSSSLREQKLQFVLLCVSFLKSSFYVFSCFTTRQETKTITMFVTSIDIRSKSAISICQSKLK